MLILLFLLPAVSSSASIVSATFGKVDGIERRSPGNISTQAEISTDLGICMDIRHRTTTDILWSCLATIFACTWVAVHPNLPGPRDSQWLRFRRRCSTMFYAVIAPELMMLWAMRQWYAAARIKAEYNSKYHHTNARPLRSAWPVFRWFSDWFRTPKKAEENLWTLTHSFFIQMGGFVFVQDDQTPIVVTFQQLQAMIDDHVIDLPSVSEEDILDKSKGDFLTKLLVVLQTTWFVIQCIGRWMAHLPVTELEVVTLAFAILNIVVVGLWWNKPQNVQTAIRLTRTAGAQYKEAQPPNEHGSWLNRKFTEDTEESDPWVAWMIIVTLLMPLRLVGGIFKPLGEMATSNSVASGATRIPKHYADHDITQETSVIFPTLGMSVIFGALHLIPWNSNPNDTERLLGRLSAAVITFEPFPAAIGTALYQLTRGHPIGVAVRMIIDALAMSLGCLGFICLPLYILARLTLLVLAFVTLRHLPPGALQDLSWSSFLPHV